MTKALAGFDQFLEGVLLGVFQGQIHMQLLSALLACCSATAASG
jgi:hypothetical protein